MSAWAVVCIALSTMCGGIAINLFIIGRYIGNQEATIRELKKLEQKYDRLDVAVQALRTWKAAHTGRENGHSDH